MKTNNDPTAASQAASAAPWPTIEPVPSSDELLALKARAQAAAESLGFEAFGVTDLDLAAHGEPFKAWLDRGYQGEMGYLARNVEKRLAPEELVPGTVRVLCVRLRYQPADDDPIATLEDPSSGYVARYALGRDYHKVVRQRLRRLATAMTTAAHSVTGDWRFRAFADSAPVLERPLAVKAGLGWVGKHTLVLDRDAGSWFFLGELFTNLPLPIDEAAVTNHCGNCRACMTVCPTDAIVAPGVLDARRCISYLTIEHRGTIPVALRGAIGNRIFGCDDCQLYCPWNRDTAATTVTDFDARRWTGNDGESIDLKRPSLLTLFRLTEEAFLKATEGSALRRLSYHQWQRNLAIALGNGPANATVLAALRERLASLSTNDADALLAEHLRWAIDQLEAQG